MGNNDGMQLKFDTFRANLRAFINAKGVLYKDLAEEIGTTRATVSRYVAGARDPEIEYVYRIARFFGVTIDYMLGVNDDDNTGLTVEARRIADLYSLASDDDKRVIEAVLRKYEAMEP